MTLNFMNHKKAVLGMCVYQNIKPVTFKSVLEVLMRDRQIKFDIEFDDALISRSRNMVAKRFLDSKYQVLVFIDDDIIFYPEQFFTLLTRCLNGYDIIGGFYPTRAGKTLASRLEKGVVVRVPVKSEPVPAEYVSTGFMAIHRRVFEKLVSSNAVKLAYGDRIKYPDVEPYYPFFEAKWYNDEWLSEDWGFCQIAKDSGLKCWLDPSVFLGHYGARGYTLRDMFVPEINHTTIIELRR